MKKYDDKLDLVRCLIDSLGTSEVLAHNALKKMNKIENWYFKGMSEVLERLNDAMCAALKIAESIGSSRSPNADISINVVCHSCKHQFKSHCDNSSFFEKEVVCPVCDFEFFVVFDS